MRLHNIDNRVFRRRIFSSLSTMSTSKSAVTGDLGSRNVYSAVIRNQTPNKVHCLVEYRTVSGAENDVVELDINGNGEEQKCEEKILSTSTNNSNSSYSSIFPKVIHSITVKKIDGSKVQLIAPFDNVPHEDVRNWKFTIDNDRIHSGKD